jgi:potassium-transporting ATPase KdpC subunit
MLSEIKKCFKISLILLVICCVCYPLILWSFGLLFPERAKGLPIIITSKVIGYENIGQLFTSSKYFHGRPSINKYDASISGGSNYGPTNQDYLKFVNLMIDSIMIENPGITKEQIPSDIVTFSGSGLDPHIIPQSAYIQSLRISKARNIPEVKIKQLIYENTEYPLFGFLGEPKINVLKLNIALDKL